VSQTLLQRITHLIEQQRIQGGWDDELVAAKILDLVRRDEQADKVTLIEGDPPETVQAV
jgi:hypothetical protein